MKWILVHRPSPALVISIIALVVAIGGTAAGANGPIARAVRGGGDTKSDKKISDSEFMRLAPSATVASALKANTATSANLATNASQAAKATQADAATNATNATNAGTATTATQLGQLTVVKSGLLNVPAGSNASGAVACPPGLNVLGGGVTIGNVNKVWVGQTWPVNGTDVNSIGSTGWGGWVNNTDTSNAYGFGVYALCAKFASVTGP